MKIIIGGAQRSGTSFLRAIVGSHSAVALFPYDLRLWTKYWLETGSSPLSRGQQQSLIGRILRDEKATIADDLPRIEEVRESLSRSEKSSITAMDVFDSFLGAYAKKRGRSVWGHKTPWNEFHAKEILDEWDDAFFIHLMRNPLDSAASTKHVDGGTWFYDPFLHIERWRRSAELALENERLYPGRYIVIRYEDLKAEPRLVTQSLCETLGLEFQEGMQTGLKQPGWGGNNSSFVSGTTTLGESREGALAGYVQTLYQRELEPQMKNFGYISTVPSQHFGPLQFFAVGLHRLWLRVFYRVIRLKEILQKSA